MLKKRKINPASKSLKTLLKGLKLLKLSAIPDWVALKINPNGWFLNAPPLFHQTFVLWFCWIAATSQLQILTIFIAVLLIVIIVSKNWSTSMLLKLSFETKNECFSSLLIPFLTTAVANAPFLDPATDR